VLALTAAAAATERQHSGHFRVTRRA